MFILVKYKYNVIIFQTNVLQINDLFIEFTVTSLQHQLSQCGLSLEWLRINIVLFALSYQLM